MLIVHTYRYWVPNVSGGLVISKIEQRTGWSFERNVEYAKTAERVGFEYALTQIRFMAGYGAGMSPFPPFESEPDNLVREPTRIGLLFSSTTPLHRTSHRDGSLAARALESSHRRKTDC